MRYTGFVEAIREGEIIRMPEKEALDEDFWILRKIYEEDKPKTNERVGSYRPGFESSMKIRESMNKPEYKKNHVLKELIDNFHWEISRMRRMKDMSRKQLAQAAGVSEDDLKMIENGILPRDDFVLITKIQQQLGINLRKDGKQFDMSSSKAASRNLDVTLADLQKMKEDKIRENIDNASKKSIAGNAWDKRISDSDIEIIE